ncbi:hypothetical protein FTUN_2267 [Frigoriglobus tundricola]|uniref:Uncharacterized protein n=1 Tax=Frigoriglobus tundricola TaxID=2774151 RepID=A0A6M5YLE7_9BACT|nr:hypothetical protein FTUN_2267 [Frigoriglobus tundricola]
MAKLLRRNGQGATPLGDKPLDFQVFSGYLVYTKWILSAE